MHHIIIGKYDMYAVYTFITVFAGCDKLDNVLMLTNTSHESNLVLHQLTIFAVITALIVSQQQGVI